MSRRLFVKNACMQYLMAFAQFVFPLLTFPYLTRVLEPDVYGIMAFLTAMSVYFQLLVDYGFNLSSTREISEHRDDKARVGSILGETMQAKVLLAAASFLLLTAMMPFVDIARRNAAAAYLYLGPVLLSAFLPDFLFRGIEKMGVLTVRFVLSKSVATALTFILVRSKNDLVMIPALNTLASMVAVLFTWVEIKRKLGLRARFAPIAAAFRRIKQSAVYFASTVATTAYGALNTVLLGVVPVPPADIGYWGTSYALICMAQSLYSPITNSLYPHMAAKHDVALVRRILLVFMPLILAASAAAFLFSGFFIRLLCGDMYAPAVPVFRALAPVLVFSFPAMVIGFPLLGTMGYVKETTGTTVASSAFHIAGLLLLALTGKFTILNIALLRSGTEAVLLAARGYCVLKLKRNGRIGAA